MGEGVYDMFMYIFGGGVFDQLVKILTINPSTNSGDDKVYYTAWKLVNTVYDSYIVPIGLGLMVIWFLVAFMQKASSEQMNFDHLFMLCVKLFAAFYLMEHGLELFAQIWGLGNTLMSDLMGSSKIASGGLSKEDLLPIWTALTGEESLDDLPGFWTSIACYGQMLFPWLVSGIISGVATFIGYSRMIEMLLRVVLAPIALSDFIVEGAHSTGMRYIKSFLAICLQGFCILMIARIYSSLVGGITLTGDFLDMTVGFMVLSFAAIAMMFKSLSFCREIVGVQ